LNGQCSVLIVDRSEETREVLQTALERRGVRTLAAGRTEAGLELARRHHPELIVLDLDDTPGCLPAGQALSPAAGETQLTASEDAYRPCLVLLGNLRGRRELLPEGEFVSKPYHYGPLIRKIEELLASANLKGKAGRADTVCDPRSRPGHPFRTERVADSSRAGCV
jgi:hypothetical protein